jgi:uncharacterized protein (DUF849 family)
MRVAKGKKVIISCAITGSIHTPTMSPHLPVTPDEIAQESIAAYEAGASILHLHAREPDDGRPSARADLFMQFLPRIKQSTDAVVNITTGGGQGMSLDQRLEAAMVAKPEMCSLNMGSINFGIFPAATRYAEWKYPWEPAYLQMTKDAIFRNTFGDIENILKGLGDFGTRFEYECYDIGHLHTLAYFVEQGLAKPPLFVQSIFGVLGGIAADIEHLMHMRRTADSLFGSDYEWSVVAAGRHQMQFTTVAGILGGNVRVGLEDSLYIGKGKLATSNAQQVSKIRTILETLDFEIATPAEVRSMLALKGADAVAF